jgi:hypothetical protein
MTIDEHLTHFAGLPVVAFDPQGEPPADPGACAWRVATNYDGGKEEFKARLRALVDSDWAGSVRALVLGEWGDSYERGAPIGKLVKSADRLAGLRALFIGEMISEECEISWIHHRDITPLLQAYPGLEILRVRGSEGLELAPLRHEALRELAFESGGLPGHIVRAVGECDLPGLSHLELWLGTDEYGGDADSEDLSGVLAGTWLPALRYLGLRDAEIADEVASALASAPVVARLETLDLSLGVLSDVGGAALLSGQPLTHLRRLDLHHHYLSDDMAQRIGDELGSAGVEVDVSDGQDDDDGDRYIAVSE